MSSGELAEGGTLTVGIAGAGLLGRLLAWRLLASGYRVSLFDRDCISSGSAAAYTAAGMLAPYSELESAESSVYQLGMHSLKLWPEWIKQLNGESLFHQGGTLVVAHPQDRAYLEHFHQVLERKLPASNQFQKLMSSKAIGELEPPLAEQFSAALFLPEEAWLHTFELMDLLAERVISSGGQWYEQTTVNQVAAHCIHTGQSIHKFDWVIDCRGLGAKQQLPQLRGVRGEVIEVIAPEVSIRRMVRIMHPRYRLYLVPRPNHQYIIGATQIESEDYSNISVRSALELLSALYAIDKGFAEARITATRTNCRPALLDNFPIINRRPGLIQANGLFRHGYLLAPAMVEQVQGVIEDSLARLPQFSNLHRSLS